MSLRPLNPSPSVQQGRVTLTALAAGRTDLGVRSTITVLVDSDVLGTDSFHPCIGDERLPWAERYAAACGLTGEDLERLAGKLAVLVEEALRRMPEEPAEWEPLVPLAAPVPALPFPIRALLSPVLMNFVTAAAAAYRTPAEFLPLARWARSPAPLACGGNCTLAVSCTPQPAYGLPR
jgi:hypothetical protein